MCTYITSRLREHVDIVMEVVSTVLLFGAGIYLMLINKFETGIALVTGATTYWFNNSNKKDN